MSTLFQIGKKHHTDKAEHGYLEVYDKHFEPLRTSPVRFLEVGVQFGNSIRSWLEYFPHPDSTIIGVDIIDNRVSVGDRRFLFMVGDAGQSEFWKGHGGFMPELNVVVDDGSHRARDQICAFDHLWPRLVSGGFYCIEDWFTQWHPYFNKSEQGIDWLADRIADLNWSGKDFIGNPTPNPNPVLSEMEKSIDFVHCFKGLVILKKK